QHAASWKSYDKRSYKLAADRCGRKPIAAADRRSPMLLPTAEFDARLVVMSLAPEHVYKLQIREFHLDTFGHVNNAVYLELFEEARWDIITARGYGLDTVMKTRIGPTILAVNVQFRRELKNRENVVIKTNVVSSEGKISILRQALFNEKGEEACTADFTIGLFDLNQRKLVLPTPEWRKAIGLDA
ncbi:MAG: acyl-CoA thioesterase, partial [Bdellovibrionota bacterium]